MDGLLRARDRNGSGRGATCCDRRQDGGSPYGRGALLRDRDAPPPLGATLNAALPPCSGSRANRRAIRAVVVGRVAHCRRPPRRRAVRVVVVSRVAHRRGPPRRRAVRVVVVGRVAHHRGPPRRRAVRVVVVGRVAHRRGPPRRRAVRVVVVGRVAHPVGGSPRRAVCATVLRPLRLRHVRTGNKGNGNHDSDCRCSFHFDFLFRSLALLRFSRGKSISNLPNFRQRADNNVQKCNYYRCAAATRFTISATALHFFRMMVRFANLAGIFPLCFTIEPFSEMARMDTYVRFVPFPKQPNNVHCGSQAAQDNRRGDQR